MKKKIDFLIVLTVLATLLIIVGCGARQAVQTETTSAPIQLPAAASAEPTPEPTAEPTPEPTPLLVEYSFEGETDWAQVEQLMRENPALRKLDLRNCTLDVREHAEALAALELEELQFTATLCGAEITDKTEVFAPQTVPEEGDLAVLKLLPKLGCIDLTAVLCEPEQVCMIQDFYPEQDVLWKLDLCGIEVGPDTEQLNYNDQPIDSLEPFYRTLPLLTKLTSLEMCGCGVGNEDMDALRTAFPQAGIVWSITTKYWTIRTDTDHFATWKVVETDEEGRILEAYSIAFIDRRLGDQDLEWLQYCHDLVALDLGHNCITNCEFVRNMPKIKYLLLADNRISDLSPVSTLPELVYLECAINPINDLTPLSNLTNLLDINMCGCYISDLSPLYGLKKLERVWMTPFELKNVTAAEEELHAVLPDCRLQFAYNTPDYVGFGWRTHPRYAEYRLALGRAKP